MELNKRWDNLSQDKKDLWNIKAEEENLGESSNKERKLSKPKKEQKEKKKPKISKKKKNAEDSDSSFSDDD